MSIFAVAVIVIAAGLLIGAVIFGVIRNHRSPDVAASVANADPGRRR